jgi:hypothetical protein
LSFEEAAFVLVDSCSSFFLLLFEAANRKLYLSGCQLLLKSNLKHPLWIVLCQVRYAFATLA